MERPLSTQTLNIFKAFVLVVLCLTLKIHSPLLCPAQCPRRRTTKGPTSPRLSCQLASGWVCPIGGAGRDQRRERVQCPSCLLSPGWSLVPGPWQKLYPSSSQFQPSLGFSPNLGEVIVIVAHLWGPQHLLYSLNPFHTCLSNSFDETTQDYSLAEDNCLTSHSLIEKSIVVVGFFSSSISLWRLLV